MAVEVPQLRAEDAEDAEDAADAADARRRRRRPKTPKTPKTPEDARRRRRRPKTPKTPEDARRRRRRPKTPKTPEDARRRRRRPKTPKTPEDEEDAEDARRRRRVPNRSLETNSRFLLCRFTPTMSDQPQTCHFDLFWAMFYLPPSAIQHNTFNIWSKLTCRVILLVIIIIFSPFSTQTLCSTYEPTWHLESCLKCLFLPLQQDNTLNRWRKLASWVMIEIGPNQAIYTFWPLQNTTFNIVQHEQAISSHV